MKQFELVFTVQKESDTLLQQIGLHIDRSQISMKAIKRVLESKGCLVNGRIERFGSRRLSKGDKVIFLWKKEPINESYTPLKLYEDADLLFIDKPPSLVSEDRIIQSLFPEYKGSLWLAHRLDKDTSGILLLVKSKEVKQKVIDLFVRKRVEKKYLTWVHGTFLRKEGTIDSRLSVKKYFEGQTIYCSHMQGNGTQAITHWKVIEEKAPFSLVECIPVTGRTHQIRVHMQALGHPILGDLQYGFSRELKAGVTRCMLHAWKFQIEHPITGVPLQLEAPIPSDFREAFRNYTV